MISFRRLYLDEYLKKYRYLMLGRVLDVGANEQAEEVRSVPRQRASSDGNI